MMMRMEDKNMKGYVMCSSLQGILDRKGAGFYTHPYSGKLFRISKKETQVNPRWEGKCYQMGH